ncbi:hypothetical protein DCAR_0311436 [Daucus carota subsp. sativus]|uniref:Aminotransferase-like plant mobile domain-containing protein n=1 Tax=Daucus carota subsp. sativus TaxID=79200 RepID=A0AAF1ATT5_DAUCS|nr:hypothetical protein DCAR_0311436 [Daucus carota subsp. sativus]
MNTNNIQDKRPLAKVYRRPDNKVIKATAGRNIKSLVGNKLVDEVEEDEHNCDNLVDEQDADQDNNQQSDEDMQEGEEDSAQEDSAEDMEQEDSAEEEDDEQEDQEQDDVLNESEEENKDEEEEDEQEEDETENQAQVNNAQPKIKITKYKRKKFYDFAGYIVQCRRSSRLRAHSLSKFTNTADTPVDLESEDQANMNTNNIQDKRPLAKVYRRPDNKVIKATAGRNIKSLVGNKLVDEVEEDEHNCDNLVDEQDADQDNNQQSDEDMQEGEEDSAQEDSAEDMEQEDSAEEEDDEQEDQEQDDVLNESEEENKDEQEEDETENQAQVNNAQPKIKITKYKRKKEAAFETHIPRKRIAGTLYPILKFMNKDVKKTEGAKHINRKKDEVKIRISPRHFSKMVGELTKEQRDWVTRAGFVLLLDFELEILPTKIAYNVLQIFDHHSISLKLKDGDINITSEDVYDVLGLPNGGHPIILASPGKYSQRIKEWHAQFSLPDQITTHMIVQVMKNQDVNDNFKLNFLVVMSNVLIGTKGASYVDKQLLQLDDNLDNLKKYNWADFLLGYLVIGMESWNRTTTTFFRGSLIFLTLLYVDRVRYKGMDLVDRQFPSYTGWTLEMLRQRQEIEVIDGVFRVGSIQPSLKEYLQKIDPSEAPKTKVNDNEDGAWDTWQYWSEVDRIENDYLKRNASTSQQPHESTQCQSPQNTQYYTPPTEAADGNVEQTEEGRGTCGHKVQI